jgi:hypothetical protein
MSVRMGTLTARTRANHGRQIRGLCPCAMTVVADFDGFWSRFDVAEIAIINGHIPARQNARLAPVVEAKTPLHWLRTTGLNSSRLNERDSTKIDP